MSSAASSHHSDTGSPAALPEESDAVAAEMTETDVEEQSSEHASSPTNLEALAQAAHISSATAAAPANRFPTEDALFEAAREVAVRAVVEIVAHLARSRRATTFAANRKKIVAASKNNPAASRSNSGASKAALVAAAILRGDPSLGGNSDLEAARKVSERVLTEINSDLRHSQAADNGEMNRAAGAASSAAAAAADNSSFRASPAAKRRKTGAPTAPPASQGAAAQHPINSEDLAPTTSSAAGGQAIKISHRAHGADIAGDGRPRIAAAKRPSRGYLPAFGLSSGGPAATATAVAAATAAATATPEFSAALSLARQAALCNAQSSRPRKPPAPQPLSRPIMWFETPSGEPQPIEEVVGHELLQLIGTANCAAPHPPSYMRLPTLPVLMVRCRFCCCIFCGLLILCVFSTAQSYRQLAGRSARLIAGDVQGKEYLSNEEARQALAIHLQEIVLDALIPPNWPD